jgi:hypothetical protein
MYMAILCLALARLGSVRLHAPEAITSLGFSPDGKSLTTFAMSRGALRHWDVKTGRPIRTRLRNR